MIAGWWAGWRWRRKAARVQRIKRELAALEARANRNDETLRHALGAHVAFLDYLTEQSKRLPYPQDYRQKYADFYLTYREHQ